MRTNKQRITNQFLIAEEFRKQNGKPTTLVPKPTEPPAPARADQGNQKAIK